MAPKRLSAILQPDCDCARAQYRLLSLVIEMSNSTVQIRKKTQHRWDKEYLKDQLTWLYDISRPETVDKWLNGEDQTKYQGETSQHQSIRLVNAGFGSKLAWILAHFPNLDWYLNEKRKQVGASLLVAVIEFGEEKLSAASCSCQIQHLPFTSAVAEERLDQNAGGATMDTHKLHDIDPSAKIATHGKTDEAAAEIQVYPGPQNSRNTSPPRKRSADYSTSANGPISAKRVCHVSGYQGAQDLSAATRETVSMDVIGASGNQVTATVTGALSSSGTDKRLMAVQGGEDDTNVHPLLESSCTTPDGLAEADILSKLLSPSAPSIMQIYPLNAYKAIGFLRAGSNQISDVIFKNEFYICHEVIDSKSVPLDIKARIPAVKEQQCTRGTERVVVVLPSEPTRRAFIIYTSHYPESNSHSQSSVQ